MNPYKCPYCGKPISVWACCQQSEVKASWERGEYLTRHESEDEERTLLEGGRNDRQFNGR